MGDSDEVTSQIYFLLSGLIVPEGCLWNPGDIQMAVKIWLIEERIIAEQKAVRIDTRHSSSWEPRWIEGLYYCVCWKGKEDRGRTEEWESLRTVTEIGMERGGGNARHDGLKHWVSLLLSKWFCFMRSSWLLCAALLLRTTHPFALPFILELGSVPFDVES